MAAGAAGVHDTGGERESGSSELFNYEMLHAASPLSLLPLSLLLFLSPKASVSKPPLLLNFHLGSRKIRETNMKKTIKHRHRNQTRTDDKDKITSILIRRPDNNVLITINYPPQCGNTRRCYQPPPPSPKLHFRSTFLQDFRLCKHFFSAALCKPRDTRAAAGV